eukprot:TRINITY_DN32471_c0_g1_i1.p1 TRINITY_DN32471_c0_g1~~TRINITY_DN32471_c0_g1_i1.p1  ORF type:complete len:1578 (-),score=217.14 TRINITY_DN32471_c0_g1_i1:90-4697(-)
MTGNIIRPQALSIITSRATTPGTPVRMPIGSTPNVPVGTARPSSPVRMAGTAPQSSPVRMASTPVPLGGSVVQARVALPPQIPVGTQGTVGGPLSPSLHAVQSGSLQIQPRTRPSMSGAQPGDVKIVLDSSGSVVLPGPVIQRSQTETIGAAKIGSATLPPRGSGSCSTFQEARVQQSQPALGVAVASHVRAPLQPPPGGSLKVATAVVASASCRGGSVCGGNVPMPANDPCLGAFRNEDGIQETCEVNLSSAAQTPSLQMNPPTSTGLQQMQQLHPTPQRQRQLQLGSSQPQRSFASPQMEPKMQSGAPRQVQQSQRSVHQKQFSLPGSMSQNQVQHRVYSSLQPFHEEPPFAAPMASPGRGSLTESNLSEVDRRTSLTESICPKDQGEDAFRHEIASLKAELAAAKEAWRPQVKAEASSSGCKDTVSPLQSSAGASQSNTDTASPMRSSPGAPQNYPAPGSVVSAASQSTVTTRIGGHSDSGVPAPEAREPSRQAIRSASTRRRNNIPETTLGPATAPASQGPRSARENRQRPNSRGRRDVVAAVSRLGGAQQGSHASSAGGSGHGGASRAPPWHGNQSGGPIRNRDNADFNVSIDVNSPPAQSSRLSSPPSSTGRVTRRTGGAGGNTHTDEGSRRNANFGQFGARAQSRSARSPGLTNSAGTPSPTLSSPGAGTTLRRSPSPRTQGRSDTGNRRDMSRRENPSKRIAGSTGSHHSQRRSPQSSLASPPSIAGGGGSSVRTDNTNSTLNVSTLEDISEQLSKGQIPSPGRPPSDGYGGSGKASSSRGADGSKVHRQVSLRLRSRSSGENVQEAGKQDSPGAPAHGESYIVEQLPTLPPAATGSAPAPATGEFLSGGDSGGTGDCSIVSGLQLELPAGAISNRHRAASTGREQGSRSGRHTQLRSRSPRATTPAGSLTLSIREAGGCSPARSPGGRSPGRRSVSPGDSTRRRRTLPLDLDRDEATLGETLGPLNEIHDGWREGLCTKKKTEDRRCSDAFSPTNLMRGRTSIRDPIPAPLEDGVHGEGVNSHDSKREWRSSLCLQKIADDKVLPNIKTERSPSPVFSRVQPLQETMGPLHEVKDRWRGSLTDTKHSLDKTVDAFSPKSLRLQRGEEVRSPSPPPLEDGVHRGGCRLHDVQGSWRGSLCDKKTTDDRHIGTMKMDRSPSPEFSRVKPLGETMGALHMVNEGWRDSMCSNKKLEDESTDAFSVFPDRPDRGSYPQRHSSLTVSSVGSIEDRDFFANRVVPSLRGEDRPIGNWVVRDSPEALALPEPTRLLNLEDGPASTLVPPLGEASDAQPLAVALPIEVRRSPERTISAPAESAASPAFPQELPRSTEIGSMELPSTSQHHPVSPSRTAGTPVTDRSFAGISQPTTSLGIAGTPPVGYPFTSPTLSAVQVHGPQGPATATGSGTLTGSVVQRLVSADLEVQRRVIPAAAPPPSTMPNGGPLLVHRAATTASPPSSWRVASSSSPNLVSPLSPPQTFHSMTALPAGRSYAPPMNSAAVHPSAATQSSSVRTSPPPRDSGVLIWSGR